MSFLSSNSEDFEQIELSSLYITPNEYQALIFEEVLTLVDADGRKLDKVTIAVEQVEAEEGVDPWQRELAVYQYSGKAGLMLRVQSTVNRALQTVSELRKITRPNYSRLLRVTDTGEGLDVFSVRIDGQEGDRSRKHIAGHRSLVLEGANILLLRRFAIAGSRWHHCRFSGHTFSHEGALCQVEYRVDHLEDKDMVRVVRTVQGEGREGRGEESMTTHLTREGRIVHHEWSEGHWRLEGAGRRPKADADDDRSEGDTDEEVPVDLDAYFEKKEELMEQMTEYLHEQADVQDMIADFLKNVLFDKPDDVLEYADNFFSTFLGIARDSQTSYKSCSDYEI